MAETSSWLKNDGPKSSVDELKTRRLKELQQAETHDGEAEEDRRQAQMYSSAASQLESKAFKLEAEAKSAEAQGETDRAAGLQAEVPELRELAVRNYKLADEKGQQASGHERRAVDHRETAKRLAGEVKTRNAEVDFDFLGF